jgi:hypothetical protein
MSNAIQFLEALGSRPALVMASLDHYEKAVCELQFDDRQHTALLARDPIAIGEALGGRTHMICAVCTPDDDSQHEAVPGDGDKDGDMVPDDEESPASQ